MNQFTVLTLAIVFSSILIGSGTNICDNASCETQINADVGKEFAITLESNSSNDFEWWMKFDPNYLTLLNSTFIRGNEESGILAVPRKEIFSFSARNVGNTEVIALLLKPWENGTIAERKILPINIMSTITPQATVPRKIVNLEANAERKTIPINVASAATALNQATVRKSVNPGPTNITLTT